MYRNLLLLLLLVTASSILGIHSSKRREFRPSHSCCQFLIKGDWKTFYDCYMSHQDLPDCDRTMNVCFHEDKIFEVGDIVENAPEKCQRRTCERVPGNSESTYQVKSSYLGKVGSIGCCLKGDIMFPEGFMQPKKVQECLTMKCRRGNWVLAEIPDCFKEEDRPCYYQGSLFLSGESFAPSDCLRLTCSQGFWKDTLSPNCSHCHSSPSQFFYPFNKHPFVLKGQCNYSVVQNGSAIGDSPSVSARFYECDPVSHVYCPTEVIIHQTEHLIVAVRLGGLVTVNGEELTLPYSNPRTPLLIWHSNNSINIFTLGQFLIKYSTSLHKPTFSIFSPPLNKDDYSKGLCGIHDDHHTWILDETRECLKRPLNDDVFDEELKKEKLEICQQVADMAYAEGCKPLMDVETCAYHICQCCVKEGPENCTSSCTLRPLLSDCKLHKYEMTGYPSKRDVKNAACQVTALLHPLVENLDCYLHKHMHIIHDLTSVWISKITDLELGMLNALRQLSPPLKEVLKSITPSLIKVGLSVSPLLRQSLKDFPRHIEETISQTEEILIKHICIWSSNCTRFLTPFRWVYDYLVRDFLSLMKPSLAESGLIWISSLDFKGWEKLVSEMKSFPKQTEIEPMLDNLGNIFNYQFQPLSDILMQLDKRIKETVDKLMRESENLDGAMCKTECELESETCTGIALLIPSDNKDYFMIEKENKSQIISKDVCFPVSSETFSPTTSTKATGLTITAAMQSLTTSDIQRNSDQQFRTTTFDKQSSNVNSSVYHNISDHMIYPSTEHDLKTTYVTHYPLPYSSDSVHTINSDVISTTENSFIEYSTLDKISERKSKDSEFGQTGYPEFLVDIRDHFDIIGENAPKFSEEFIWIFPDYDYIDEFVQSVMISYPSEYYVDYPSSDSEDDISSLRSGRFLDTMSNTENSLSLLFNVLNGTLPSLPSSNGGSFDLLSTPFPYLRSGGSIKKDSLFSQKSDGIVKKDRDVDALISKMKYLVKMKNGTVIKDEMFTDILAKFAAFKRSRNNIKQASQNQEHSNSMISNETEPFKLTTEEYFDNTSDSPVVFDAEIFPPYEMGENPSNAENPSISKDGFQRNSTENYIYMMNNKDFDINVGSLSQNYTENEENLINVNVNKKQHYITEMVGREPYDKSTLEQTIFINKIKESNPDNKILVKQYTNLNILQNATHMASITSSAKGVNELQDKTHDSTPNGSVDLNVINGGENNVHYGKTEENNAYTLTEKMITHTTEYLTETLLRPQTDENVGINSNRREHEISLEKTRTPGDTEANTPIGSLPLFYNKPAFITKQKDPTTASISAKVTITPQLQESSNVNIQTNTLTSKSGETNRTNGELLGNLTSSMETNHTNDMGLGISKSSPEDTLIEQTLNHGEMEKVVFKKIGKMFEDMDIPGTFRSHLQKKLKTILKGGTKISPSPQKN